MAKSNSTDEKRPKPARVIYHVMGESEYLGKPWKKILSPPFPNRRAARDWAKAHKIAGSTFYISQSTIFP